MKIRVILLFVSLFVCAACRPLNSLPPQNLSPTETMQALNEAAKNKDIEKTKNLVSSGTIKLLEESAKAQKTTVDELLKADGGAPFQELPEMRNETITGENATVEIKNTVTGEWQPIPFVRENGVWKVALDVVYRAVTKQAEDAPPNSANSANADK